jgi:hypothetical protein
MKTTPVLLYALGEYSSSAGATTLQMKSRLDSNVKMGNAGE